MYVDNATGEMIYAGSAGKVEQTHATASIQLLKIQPDKTNTLHTRWELRQTREFALNANVPINEIPISLFASSKEH